MLLSILAFKVLAFSISCFSDHSNSFALEKSTEENKDKEEETYEKNKKKLVFYEFTSAVNQSLILTNFWPDKNCWLKIKIGINPLKAVLTPPPNTLC